MTTLSRRKQRRVEYGRAQNLWRRNPRRYYDQLMEGTGVISCLPKEIMVPFWEALMTDARDVCPPEPQQELKISCLWAPIMLPEVREALPECHTAPGPDGLSARILRKMPTEILARIYNLLLWCRRLPVHLRSARKVLIPKIKESSSPAEYRPITVASTLVRGFHKVLARRMNRLISLVESKGKSGQLTVVPQCISVGPRTTPST